MPDAHATLEAVSDEALARRIGGGLSESTDADEAELYRRFAPHVRLYGRRHLQNAGIVGVGAETRVQPGTRKCRRPAIRRWADKKRNTTLRISSERAVACRILRWNRIRIFCSRC
jgi:hypothetical protein